ncbi:NAD(P)/FAD-dependent oxidoreductase [Nitrosomonas sp.]|uniref:NAD(P)/FAD-dependent oxidoreductase n=1 Tax=Nitrosomonas sp. TaxID=42353 RepID=UPI00208CCDA9|nr:tryptophan 7-halogenase [Nitrosomonas sp.]GJL75998.1 MAG: hypothetical protein NMNS02_21040 [Nitrosomonas sp.]
MNQHFDVVIAGAGAAGCAAAIALLQQMPQLSVLLLERDNGTPPQFRIGETLPPQATVLLQQLGLLESFGARDDMVALGTRAIWGAAKVNENPFLYSFYGHGWHLDRVSFDGWLLLQAERAGAVVIKGAVVAGTPEYGQGWHLTVLQDGTEPLTIAASVVVDASGRGAAFCRNLGVRVEKLDKLVGIFRFYQADAADEIDVDHAHTGNTGSGVDSFTLVESCADGWWYSACLPQGRRVAALMTDGDIARRSNLLDEAGWCKALNCTGHTQKRLIHAIPLTPLQIKPAHSQRLDRFCGRGWYAAGDAATVFDPLSSLGIFKALRHGLLVSYAICDDLQGKAGVRQKYQHVLSSEFRHYLQTREQYYQLEHRFADAPFWQRRHEKVLVQMPE